jgi:hypothetical protein
LISDPADFETWLSGSPDEAFKPARSFATEQMRIMQSGAERKNLLALPDVGVGLKPWRARLE